MLHTYFYQTVISGEYKTTYRHAVTGLPHIPDSVFDFNAPPAGWEVVDVRYDITRGEVHVVLENRVCKKDQEDPGEIDRLMQQRGWQRAPRDVRFCPEVEFKTPVLPASPSGGRRRN